jgi:DeoR/GlpR family transcriptional regulator of sugar metabolism
MIRDGYYRVISQAADLMGVSGATLNRGLRSLNEKGLIIKEGNMKSGVWSVTGKSEAD